MKFDYGNVLSSTLQITWRHKSFWLFMIVPLLISFLLFGIFAAPPFFPELSGEQETVFLVIWIVALVLGIVVSAAAGTVGIISLSLGILRIERGEGSTTFMDLLRDGFQYFWRALGVILILQLTIGAVFTLFFLFIAFLTAVTMGMAAICLQPVMILLTPLSFLVLAVMNGGILAVMDEGLGAWEAVKRAFEVIREHVWKFIILIFITYFGTTIITSILLFPAMFPAMLAPLAMEAGERVFMLIFILLFLLFFSFMGFLSGVSGVFMTTALELAYLRLAKPAGDEVVYAAPELVPPFEQE